jgi:hypothetical protein
MVRTDPATGKKIFTETGATYTDPRTGKVIPKTQKVAKLEIADNAHALSSGTHIEKVYADHSNKLKALANQARKDAYHTQMRPYSPSAAKAYSNEVATLNAKLAIAERNAPLERQAQILGNANVRARKQANPEMDHETEKKIKSQALEEARARTGAGKSRIEITPAEWEAVQAGAISNHKLTRILQNSDLDEVKKLATPKSALLMTSAKKSRAASMLLQGYTQAEVAEALGVSLTTLKTNL